LTRFCELKNLMILFLVKQGLIYLLVLLDKVPSFLLFFPFVSSFDQKWLIYLNSSWLQISR